RQFVAERAREPGSGVHRGYSKWYPYCRRQPPRFHARCPANATPGPGARPSRRCSPLRRAPGSPPTIAEGLAGLPVLQGISYPTPFQPVWMLFGVLRDFSQRLVESHKRGPAEIEPGSGIVHSDPGNVVAPRAEIAHGLTCCEPGIAPVVQLAERH